MTYVKNTIVIFPFSFSLRSNHSEVVLSSSSSSDVFKGLFANKKIPPERGNIFDRNGQPLVTNQIKYQLYIEPKYVIDEEILIIKLSRELGIEEASISAKFNKTKDWIAIASGITREKYDAIQALQLSGIGFNEEASRNYPEGSQSAHLLGFVGKKSGW